MSEDLAVFCDRWLAAWTGDRPDELLGYYSEDAEYSDPANPGGLRGHAALREYFNKLLRKYPDWEWRREELAVTPRGFVLKWRAKVPIEGKVLELQGMDRIELRDGKIARNEVYFDPSPLLGKASR